MVMDESDRLYIESIVHDYGMEYEDVKDIIKRFPENYYEEFDRIKGIKKEQEYQKISNGVGFIIVDGNKIRVTKISLIGKIEKIYNTKIQKGFPLTTNTIHRGFEIRLIVDGCDVFIRKGKKEELEEILKILDIAINKKTIILKAQ